MRVTLSAGPYSSISNHPLGLVHKYTEWQIAYDTGYDTAYDLMPYLLMAWDDVNKYSIELDVPECEHYRFRVRYIDGLEIEGAWSDSIAFNTMLPTGTAVEYVPEFSAAEVLMIEEIIDDLIGWSQEPCPEVSMEIEESSEVVAVSLDQTFQVIYIDEGPSIVDPCDV